MERRRAIETYGSKCLLAALSIAALAGCGGLPTEDTRVTTGALYSGVGKCDPFDDNSACLCTDANQQGTCWIYSVDYGFLVNPQAFAPIPNDQLSSFALGANVHLSVFVDDQFYYTQGNFWTPFSPIDFLPGTPSTENMPDEGWPMNYNDVMSSFRVVRQSDFDACQSGNIPAGTAAVYTDKNFGGDCVVLYPGDYPNPTWAPGTNGTKGNFGLHNDWMSSIRVSPGTTVTLWKDAATFTNGQLKWSGLHTPPITTDCPDLSVMGANDLVSAVQVH